MLAIILIAISLSIDSLGIGITYGVRKIIVPFIPKLIIAMMSALVTFLSLALGTELLKIMPPSLTKIMGVLILLLMGFYLIIQSKNKKLESNLPPANKSSVYQIIIKSLNLTIQIIHHPQLADINGSKKIELPEAVCIGLALSIDSIGSGIGLSMLGFSHLCLPIATAICQYVFLSFGIFIGNKLSTIKLATDKFVFISGLILIAIAILRIF